MRMLMSIRVRPRSGTGQVGETRRVVWKGDSFLPRECKGIRVLGAPFETLEYVGDQLVHKSREQETLFMRTTRANFWFRMIRPDQILQFSERHDAAVALSLCHPWVARSSSRRTGDRRTCEHGLVEAGLEIPS